MSNIFEWVEPLNDTKVIIKSLYRDVYRKLPNDWVNELEDIHKNISPTSKESDEKQVIVVKICLCAGNSFTPAVINDFRKDSQSQKAFLK